MAEGVRVTVEDLATGECESREIVNDYIVVVAGRHYVDGMVVHSNGTAVVTIKTVKSDAAV